MRFGSTGLRAGSRPPRSTDDVAPGAESGFTLLETLTALTILGIALVSLFDAHQRGLRAARVADDYVVARILAQSLLADATTGNSGVVVPRQGNEGRFGWAIEVHPAGGGWADLKSESNWRLNHVRVTVAWDADRRVQLDTLKLGRAQ
jgi:prepilin-type N-terminal cleavage/methylation domain-containing protein